MIKNGFLLIELLIVVGIVGVVSTVVVATINPIEQVNRATDTKLFWEARELVSAVQRATADQELTDLGTDITAEKLDSSAANQILDQLKQTGEWKETKLRPNDHAQLFMTLQGSDGIFAVCFAPKSRSFTYNRTITIFDKDGSYNTSCNGDCFTCALNTTRPLTTAVVTPDPTAAPINECEPFDPAYPRFAWTCNNADQYSEIGCTNFCVADLGCNQPDCPPNRRLLRKEYYGVGAVNFTRCLMSPARVNEVYCASEADSRCDFKSYATDPSDYEYGCSDPVRPFKFKD